MTLNQLLPLVTRQQRLQIFNLREQILQIVGGEAADAISGREQHA
jgi:hypothetical protein